MERSKTTLRQQIQFKTYPKNEQVKDDYTNLIQLIIRMPLVVHQMSLNYVSIPYLSKSVQSENIHKPLQGLKQIDALSISLDERHLKKKMSLENISKGLKWLSSLQHLKLRFDSSRWAFHQGFTHLINALASMRLLSKLTLHFRSCNWVNDTSLHLLFKSLKKQTQLQFLDLDLTQCFNVTEKSFKSLAAASKHSLQSLKELRLRVVDLDFKKGRGLDFIASVLVSLKNLQRLCFNFSNIQISQETDFTLLMSSIKHLKSLRSLGIDFLFLPISVTTLKHLTTSFASLKQLHTLSLNFSFSETFTLQEMKTLAQSFQSLASSLKKLALYFNYSESVNDQALQILSDGLKTLTNLSEINLQCNTCKNVGDAGVASVTHALGGLPNLHSVTLNFLGCYGIKNVYENELKMNKNIRTLDFKYSRSYI